MINTKSSSGFTLYELLITLVIIALVSAFVVPKMTGALTSVNAKTAAKQTAAALRYARNQAASTQQMYYCVFDMEDNHLKIGPAAADLYETPDYNFSDVPDESESDSFKTYRLPEGVVFAEISGTGEPLYDKTEQIVFYPAGGSTGGEVILKGERNQIYAVRVDFITGLVTLQGG